ncbi:MAG: hypothetical protein ACI39R_02660 [Lachnospiraceae bacterium]
MKRKCALAERILYGLFCFIIIAFIVLMFTGKTGAIISITAFMVLLIFANIPDKKSRNKTK